MRGYPLFATWCIFWRANYSIIHRFGERLSTLHQLLHISDFCLFHHIYIWRLGERLSPLHHLVHISERHLFHHTLIWPEVIHSPLSAEHLGLPLVPPYIDLKMVWIDKVRGYPLFTVCCIFRSATCSIMHRFGKRLSTLHHLVPPPPPLVAPYIDFNIWWDVIPSSPSGANFGAPLVQLYIDLARAYPLII